MGEPDPEKRPSAWLQLLSGALPAIAAIATALAGAPAAIVVGIVVATAVGALLRGRLFREPPSRGALVSVAVSGVLAGIAVWGVGRVFDSEELPSGVRPGTGPEGRILSPTRGERVPTGTLMADGTLGAIPDDHHVWLAVQRGNNLFPKEPEISAAERTWSKAIEEAGPPHEFSLVLLMVNRVGQNKIRDWLREGHRVGRFPPFRTIAGSTPLHVVHVVQG